MAVENPYHPFASLDEYNAAIEQYNEQVRWRKMVNQYGLQQATPGLWRARRKAVIKVIWWFKEPPAIIYLLAIVGLCHLLWLATR